MRNITGPNGFADLQARYERSQKKKRENSQIAEVEEHSKNTTIEADPQEIANIAASKEKEDLFLKSLNESIQHHIEENERKLFKKKGKDINSIFREKAREGKIDEFVLETKQTITQKVFEEYVKNIDPSLKAAHRTFTEETSKIKENIRSETSNETRLRTKSRSDSEIEETLKSWKEENKEMVDKKDEYFRELNIIGGCGDHVSRLITNYYADTLKKIKAEEVVTPPISPINRNRKQVLKASGQESSGHDLLGL